uniref:ATP synthase subunit delta n=1 Tax=Roseihalotalea indica TaxID=2867963 RepID=A0AA49GQI8_9BACT|nr:ATP synthase F1 subunit delta [Tunicatimonas sp. TK19036]
MTDVRVASRYAKSLIELAIEKNALEDIYKDMQLFSETCQSNRDFLLMLKNPIINHNKKKAILYKIFQGRVNEASLAIFDIITRKNREAILPSIAEEFISQYRQYNGIDKVVVTSSVPLTSELRQKLISNIKERTGKKVDLTEKVDPNLIGGFVLQIGDRMMDNSVKSKLKALEYEFTDETYNKEF